MLNPFRRKARPTMSPVLVVDALGVSALIDGCRDTHSLSNLAQHLDFHFHAFMSKIPYRLMLVGRKSVFGTGEFTTLRFNEMFVLYSQPELEDLPYRYLVAASLVYHQLLNGGFVVRGGLGFGMILRNRDLLIGRGFLDAYRIAEKRDGSVRNVCAITVSPSFFKHVAHSERCCRLLCLYEDHYFLHPTAITDPELGEFNRDRILRHLADAETDRTKLLATERFLENYEDYEAALNEGSRTRELTGWLPPDQRKDEWKHSRGLGFSAETEFDDWPAVWRELARTRGTSYLPTEREPNS